MKKKWWTAVLACVLMLTLCAGQAGYGEEDALLAGAWYDEDGTAVLKITPDGDFSLESAETAVKGYLVQAEESDGIWDGPRYVLYGLNEEPLPDDMCLLIDPEYPDEIVLSYGDIAQLFLRESGDVIGADGGAQVQEPDGPQTGAEPGAQGLGPEEQQIGADANVRVQWLDDSQIDPDACVHFAADTSEWAIDTVFTVRTAVRDFKVLALSLDLSGDQDGFFFDAVELYTLPELTPERPLAVAMAFYGDIPNNGVAYTDETGTVRYFSVEMSGEDGELYLSQISVK